jgi:hypothetical protein
VQRIELLLGQGKINNVNPRLKLKKLRRQWKTTPHIK